MKLICCLKGAVLDIAVDVRAGSSTLLQWYGEELSEENRKLILIPEGVAHGIQTLTDDVEMLYLHSTEFVPSAETGINPLDPSLAIKWDSEITEISARDDAHQFLNSTFGGITT
jgi:dTDP-4-dehydrorhamnose 3,5-epimerase